MIWLQKTITTRVALVSDIFRQETFSNIRRRWCDMRHTKLLVYNIIWSSSEYLSASNAYFMRLLFILLFNLYRHASSPAVGVFFLSISFSLPNRNWQFFPPSSDEAHIHIRERSNCARGRRRRLRNTFSAGRVPTNPLPMPPTRAITRIYIRFPHSPNYKSVFFPFEIHKSHHVPTQPLFRTVNSNVEMMNLLVREKVCVASVDPGPLRR